MRESVITAETVRRSYNTWQPGCQEGLLGMGEPAMEVAARELRWRQVTLAECAAYRGSKQQHYNVSQMIQHNTLIAKLMDLLQEIALNIEYPYQFNSERSLADHKTYFDLCQYIFPELQPQIQAILNSASLPPPQQLNYLFALLSRELNVDLFSKVEGSEILRFNLKHINQFVLILHEYSKIIKSNLDRSEEVRSEDRFGSREQRNEGGSQSARYDPKATSGPSSARKAAKIRNADPHLRENRGIDGEQGEQGEEGLEGGQGEPRGIAAEYEQRKGHYQHDNNYLLPAQAQPKKAKKDEKRERRGKGRENLHENIVNTIMKEKTQMLKAQARDNRKNQLGEVERAKKEYRNYLQNYIKHNKANQSREKSLAKRAASAARPASHELPLRDFQQVDNFFQSFACRFRDRKAAYVRTLSQLIRRQELDRYCHHNRIQRETKEYMQRQLSSELAAARHQHSVKSQLIRETAQNLQQEVCLLRKEELRLGKQQRKQLRDAKKQELQKIENVLHSDNQRVLMNLQEGGRLEQLILKIYKKL